jgi:alpha-beta hydrolase superfamily lysophospholipase
MLPIYRWDSVSRLDSLVFGSYNRRVAPNRTTFDWLSRDEKEVEKFHKDPLCGFPLTAPSWLDFSRAGPGSATPLTCGRSRKDCPCT